VASSSSHALLNLVVPAKAKHLARTSPTATQGHAKTFSSASYGP
jgi:hypothetical protein